MLSFWNYSYLILTFSLSSYGSSFLRRDNSLISPYTSGWIPSGACVINPSFVRLTGDTKSVTGNIHNVYPLYSRDWEVHLSFRVHGSTGSMFGDGFAFWLVENPKIQGPALGGASTFRGLGIFLDTYSNHNGDHSHEHPYISAMINNGSQIYDHDQDGTHTQLAGCHAPFRNKPHDTLLAIRYYKNTLKVSTDIENSGEWSECFFVSGVHLPTGLRIGLSAATGDLSDNHDVTYLKTYELDVKYTDEELLEDTTIIEPFAATAEQEREHVATPPPASKFWSVLFWLSVACLVFGCLYYVFSAYQSRQKRSKRLF